jgi:hypothetical protein
MASEKDDNARRVTSLGALCSSKWRRGRCSHCGGSARARRGRGAGRV